MAPKSRYEANEIAKKRLKEYYDEPASDECIRNRQEILRCFLLYENKLDEITIEPDELELEVYKEIGVPAADPDYIRLKGKEIIMQLPMKATVGILNSEPLHDFDYYDEEDKHEYAVASSIGDVLDFSIIYLKKYRKRFCEFVEDIVAQENKPRMNKKLRMLSDRLLEDYESRQNALSDTMDDAYKMWIGEKWLGVYKFETDTQETVAFPGDGFIQTIKNLSKPITYSILNSKVTNQYSSIEDRLLSYEPDGQLSFLPETIPVRQSPKNTKVVNTIVGLSYNGDLSRKLSRITGYDKAVLNAICSAYQAGNTAMTISDIFRVMNGNTKKDPTEKQKDKIRMSINKLGSTIIHLDISEEISAKYITIDDSRVVKGVIDDALLHCTGGLFKTEKGVEVYAISILKEPILMTYSKAKGQIVSFPTYLLDTKSVSSTDDIIAIKEYLLQQITLLKNGLRDSNVILYDSIYESCRIEDAQSKVVAKRRRDSIDKLLEEWKCMGYITGHANKKKGKSFVGVSIKV